MTTADVDVPPVGSGPDEPLPPGTPVDRTNCAREQIHLTAAVQPGSVLLCVSAADLRVVQSSADAGDLFDGPVHGRSLTELLGAAAAADLVAGPAQRFHRLASGSGRLTRTVDAAGYVPDPRLLVVELEPRPDQDDETPAGIPAALVHTVQQLQLGRSVAEVLETGVRLLREITGYDRAWAYRFEPDEHGVIVAEDAAPGLAGFLGLHYPAGDVPPQARALYLRNRVRSIPDADADPTPLEPPVNPVTGGWLDQSDGAARAVSPVHLRYLRNMGAHAALSVAVEVQGRLWGLLSAHDYRGPRRVPPEVRTVAELLGLVLSTRVADLEATAREAAEVALDRHRAAVLEGVAAAPSVLEGLAAAGAALLRVCDSAGVVVRVGGELRLVGATPPAMDVARLLDWLDAAPATGEGTVAVADLPHAAPSLADLAGTASGVLAVPLSRAQRNWIVWLRPEQPRTVVWGASAAPVVVQADGQPRSAPRESFERWRESVLGRARAWAPSELASADRLRAGLGTHLIARAEELARLNARLAQVNEELDAFTYSAAHDLKEPLRGIHVYATFLAEDYADTLDEAGRDRLAAILSLSRRMGVLIDSLLDYSRLTGEELHVVRLDLREVLRSATELVGARLEAAGGQVLLEDPGPPGALVGDPDRVVDVLANLLANAVKYRSAEPPVVRVGVRPVAETRRGPALVPAAAAGAGSTPAVYVADNGIGIAPEDQEEVFRVFRRLHRIDERRDPDGGAGAGLGVCRRIVHRHGGVMWVESEPGRGATFYFTLGP